MLNFELRIRLARCGHCTPCHRAALFIFHSSPFTSRKGHFSLFTFHSSLPEVTLLTSHRDHSSLFTLHFSLPEGTLFTQMTQCGASGIAARSIGHCSALHRPLQCAAFFGALSCTAGGTPPSSLFQKTENKNAARWDTPHSIVCLTLLSCLPSLLKPMRGRRVFRSDLFTTAPAFLRVSFPIPREPPWAASSMLLPHPLEQGV